MILGEGRKAIEDNEFCGREDLTEVTIADGVRSIGSYAFAKCGNLTKICLNEQIEKIESGAFEGCSKLEEIVIPQSANDISLDAFRGCTSLKTIVLPDSFNEPHMCELRECTALERVIVGPAYQIVDDCIMHIETRNLVIALPSAVKNGRVRIPEPIVSVWSENSLSLCKSATCISLAKSVEWIKGNALRGLDRITSIEIEEGSPLKSDGGLIYRDDTLLLCFGREKTKLRIPKTFNRIKSDITIPCPDIEEIEIETSNECETPLVLEPHAFCGCKRLKKVSFKGDRDVRPQEFTFGNCENLEIVENAKFAEIGDYSFSGCPKLKDVPLCDETRYIGYDAFACCESLTRVVIPTGVTIIEDSSFAQCVNLQEVDLHDDVTAIRRNAFMGCEKLKNIDLPQGLNEVCEGAFAESGLESVCIPSSVKTLKNFAFYRCAKLEAATMPSRFFKRSDKIFLDCNKLEMLGANNKGQ